MTEIEVRGQPPSSPERVFWRKAIQEIRKDSIKTVEEAARQLIALITLLSGLYFHAITFSKLPKADSSLKLLFVAPLALWTFCLLAAGSLSIGCDDDTPSNTGDAGVDAAAGGLGTMGGGDADGAGGTTTPDDGIDGGGDTGPAGMPTTYTFASRFNAGAFTG